MIVANKVLVYYTSGQEPTYFRNVNKDDLKFWKKDSGTLLVVNAETGHILVDHTKNQSLE